MAKIHLCPRCNAEMKLVSCTDQSDGFKWECQIQIDGKIQKVETSIQKGSWFAQSNMTKEEVPKFITWRHAAHHC